MPDRARKPPFLAAYEALAESRFARAMNWLVAAAGVAYAAWLVASHWPSPGPYDALACLAAGLGVWLAAADIPALSRRLVARFVLRRMVRRPNR